MDLEFAISKIKFLYIFLQCSMLFLAYEYYELPSVLNWVFSAIMFDNICITK